MPCLLLLPSVCTITSYLDLRWAIRDRGWRRVDCDRGGWCEDKWICGTYVAPTNIDTGADHLAGLLHGLPLEVTTIRGWSIPVCRAMPYCLLVMIPLWPLESDELP